MARWICPRCKAIRIPSDGLGPFGDPLPCTLCGWPRKEVKQ